MNDLSTLGMKEIMQQAYLRHIVIPAFNIPYLPLVKPIAETLKKFRAFGLVAVARPDVAKFEAKSFQAVAEELNRYADRRYIRLHLDHTPVIDEDGYRVDWKSLIEEALRSNYDSVMIDGSRLTLEENIQTVKAAVALGHAGGVPVEAELGAVLGHEKGPLPPYEELFRSGKGFTDIAEAERFVRETSVDWLSVAIGNIHGAISGAGKDQKKVEARLNIEHLRKISERVGVPLVLHGGSGIKLESVLESVKNGIAKINVGTALRQVYEKTLKESGDMEKTREAVAEVVAEHIKNYRLEGSAERLAFSLNKEAQ